MTEIKEPPHPTLDKIAAVSDESNAIGRFLDWLGGQDITLCTFVEGEAPWDDGMYAPVHKSIKDLLAEYFDIDTAEEERERRALLEYVRKVQEEAQS